MMLRAVYALSAMQEVQRFLRGKPSEPWCKECIQRVVGRRVHSVPVQLEGYRGFRREDARCVGCGNVRLIVKYTA